MSNEKTNRDLFLECRKSTMELVDKLTQERKSEKTEIILDKILEEYQECSNLSEKLLKETSSKKIQDAIISSTQRLKVDIEMIKLIKNNLLNPTKNNDEEFAKQLSNLQFASGLISQKEDISWSNITLVEFKNNEPSPYVDTTTFMHWVSILFVILFTFYFFNKNKKKEQS